MEYEELTRVLSNPVKRSVLAALANDGPMTPRMLLQTIHTTSQATLYRAISGMESEGLIHVVSEEKKRAVVEKTYDIPKGLEGVKAAIVRDNNGPAYSALIGWYLHNLHDQFVKYSVKEDIDIGRDASGYVEGRIWIDGSDLQNFLQDIGRVLEKYSVKEGDGKSGHRVGVVVAPPEEMM